MKYLIFSESRIPTPCWQGILEEMCITEWIGFKYSQAVKEFFFDIILLSEFSLYFIS
jgi:hypothetical protein